MTRRLGVLAIALSLLGCSAQASISASAGGAKTAAAAEPLKPRESAWEKEAREEAEIATRAGTPVPQTEVAATDAAAPSETAAVSSPTKARRSKKAARGKSKKNQDQGAEIAAANEEQPDHDRGHGNDLDGVDEDNPGKSKRKK
jgi:hypothetical protein